VAFVLALVALSVAGLNAETVEAALGASVVVVVVVVVVVRHLSWPCTADVDEVKERKSVRESPVSDEGF